MVRETGPLPWTLGEPSPAGQKKLAPVAGEPTNSGTLRPMRARTFFSGSFFYASAAGWVFSAACLISGCPLAPSGLAEGGPCVRSTQCAPGLVCSAANVCTSDLTGFGTGMVPNTDVPVMDAGEMADAGEMPDVPGLDAPIIPMDTPIIPMDTPIVVVDAPPVIDTGVDAGMPDAGEPDAGVPDPDTGVPEDAP